MTWSNPSLSPRLEEKLVLRQKPLPLLLQDLELLTTPLEDLEDLLRRRLGNNLFGALRPPEWSTSLENLSSTGEEVLPRTPSLEEHLLPQIALCPGLLPEFPASRLLLWITPRGWLGGNREEIAADLGFSPQEWEHALTKLQNWVDPPGLLAEDARQCLLLQLGRRGLDSADGAVLLRCHAALLEEGRRRELLKITGWSSPRLENAFKMLRQLDPSPGNLFSRAPSICPEIEVFFAAGNLKVHFLGEYAPRIFAQEELLEWRHHESMAGEWGALLGLLRGLASRCRTKLKGVMEAARRQEAFLAGAQDAPGPLVLEEVARPLGCALSTVQRLGASTWIRTPRGVCLLRALFSRPLTCRRDLSVAQLRHHLRIQLPRKSIAVLARELRVPPRTLRWHRRRLGGGSRNFML